MPDFSKNTRHEMWFAAMTVFELAVSYLILAVLFVFCIVLA